VPTKAPQAATKEARGKPFARLPEGRTITGARPIFRNVRDWDDKPNRLSVHPLDDARNAGVNSFSK
jgi:hypothetical protein